MGRKRKPKREIQSSSVDAFRTLWIALAVGMAAFVLYLPSLRSGFVYDAEAQILANDYIHIRSNVWDLITFRVLGQDVLDGSRPVQLLSLMGDSLCWGKNPIGYHFTSLLLHALNTALLFLVLLKFLENEVSQRAPQTLLSCRLAAAAAALLFAFHPGNVEAVAEVCSREDALATFFMLGSLLLAMKFACDTPKRWGIFACCLFACLLAVGSKETGMASPFLLGLCWLLYRRGKKERWVLLTVCSFAIVGIFSAARFIFHPKVSHIFIYPAEYLGGSLEKVFEIQPKIWAFSIFHIFWPLHLSANYNPQDVQWISLPVAIAVMILFLLLQVGLAWKNRAAAFGMGMFWLGMAPVSNFIPIFNPVADRYLYLPLVGMAFMAGGTLFLCARRRMLFFGALAFLICILAGFGILTVKRQSVFANSLNLWRDTLVKSPTSSIAAGNLGFALLDNGDNTAALQAFKNAVDISHGKSAEPWAGAAIAFERLGKWHQAEMALRKAIEINKIYANPKRLRDDLYYNPQQADNLERILKQMPEIPAENL